MLTTTFRLLKEAHACLTRYKVLAKALGGVRSYGRDKPIPILEILETNGLDDALWALRATSPEQAEARDRMARIVACDYAERVLYLFQELYPNDLRPAECITTVRRFISGQASREEVVAAAEAAWAAGAEAAGAAGWAAEAAGEAGWVAEAAGEAGWGWAAEAAGEAAGLARAAVRAATKGARIATEATEKRWQTEHLRELLEAIK